MTKQPTRERERQQWQKKNDIVRAYGLVEGLLSGLKSFGKEADQDGLENVLTKVKEILKKYGGIND